jgi:hypothetical protein
MNDERVVMMLHRLKSRDRPRAIEIICLTLHGASVCLQTEASVDSRIGAKLENYYNEYIGSVEHVLVDVARYRD